MNLIHPSSLKRPDLQFTVLAAVFGLLYLICVPPFQVADEERHFFRAYQIAEGHLVSEVHDGQAGGWLPVSVAYCGTLTDAVRWDLNKTLSKQDILDAFSVPLNPSERVFVSFRSATYSPIAYLPAAAAMRVGIWCGASPMLLFYLGRCANLVVWVALIGLAIRLVPFYKWLFVVLALTPMSLYQGASLSADSAANALAFVTLALILAIAFGDDASLKRKTLLILCGLTVLLTLTKNILVGYCLLFFLVPVRRLGHFKRYVLWLIVLVGINAGVFLLWCLIVRNIPVFWNADVYPDRQLTYILEHPVGYLATLLGTIRHNIYYYYSGFVGAFGWRFLYLSKWHVRLWLVLLLGIALTGGDRPLRLTIRQKTALLGISALLSAMFFTLMYLYWNPVGAGRIEGIQSRYFIPIAPLLLLLLDNRTLSSKYDAAKVVIVPLATVLSLSVALAVILQRFYGAA